MLRAKPLSPKRELLLGKHETRNEDVGWQTPEPNVQATMLVSKPQKPKRRCRKTLVAAPNPEN